MTAPECKPELRSEVQPVPQRAPKRRHYIEKIVALLMTANRPMSPAELRDEVRKKYQLPRGRHWSGRSGWICARISHGSRAWVMAGMACPSGGIGGLRMGRWRSRGPREMLSGVATDPFFFCRDRCAQNHAQQLLRICGAADQLPV